MWKQYIKQALYQLKENRLISIVCMVGTALAICMIMVIVLTLQIRIKDCVPEVNRSRSLYVKAMTSRHKEQHNNAASSQMSVTTARECFKTLTIPEAVTITSVNNKMRASLPGGGRMSVKWKRMKRSGKSFALNSCVANHIRKPILRVGCPRQWFLPVWHATCSIQLTW
mgnify:CR=1 FL=1